MMDTAPIFPQSIHPVKPSRRRDGKRGAKSYPRTRRSPRYWLIDFRLSCQFLPKDGPPLARFVGGNDWLRMARPTYHDVFASDVFIFGTWIRDEFVEVSCTSILSPA